MIMGLLMEHEFYFIIFIMPNLRHGFLFCFCVLIVMCELLLHKSLFMSRILWFCQFVKIGLSHRAERWTQKKQNLLFFRQCYTSYWKWNLKLMSPFFKFIWLQPEEEETETSCQGTCSWHEWEQYRWRYTTAATIKNEIAKCTTKTALYHLRHDRFRHPTETS